MVSLLDSDAVSVYRRLISYVTPHWKVIAGAVAAMLLYSGANAVVPFIMKAVIDTLGDAGRSGGGYIPLMLLAAAAVRGSTDFVAVYGLGWLGRRVIRDLRSELFQQYTALPARFFDQASTGILISKLTYNTEQVAEAISTVLVVAVRDSLTMIVLVGAMIYFSPILTVLVAITIPIVGFLVGVMSRAFRRYSTRIQASLGDATRVTEEALSGQQIVKVFEGQAYELRHFNVINRRNYKVNLKLVATRAVGDALTQYTLAIGIAAVIWVAFSEQLAANLDAPTFMGFLTAMGMLLGPMKRVININVALQRGIAAGESLFEILDEPVEQDRGTITLTRARGDIEFRNVSFTYDPNKGRVLHDVSIKSPAGSTIAIVGRSGSGKTTLVGLLPRLYEIEGGAVLMDDIDIREYRLTDLRRQISLVSQDVILFDDTIANNIAYGVLASSSRAAIERAADMAHVTEFAEQLPEGLETNVGQRGILLSGGQRQRIAIARALLKDAPILILDEATSALDSESERRIQGALAALMRGRTTLVIAHRLSTVEGADCIIVLKDGAVVEQGTHEELLSLDGYYGGLHRMQFAV
ncbi:MAG: lipid A export permease/ATP-binding protein MsbA [Gammaproteobacteria bacterium]|nr:MAG: lipid A export permease/ATP-binding protein MsbA [Gammaproteobacteria bacterium]TDJ45498.1 MAG: lipid A export permease/ATP-binding protein MsbA [Gammaproteobacteria bacterium]